MIFEQVKQNLFEHQNRNALGNELFLQILHELLEFSRFSGDNFCLRYSKGSHDLTLVCRPDGSEVLHLDVDGDKVIYTRIDSVCCGKRTLEELRDIVIKIITRFCKSRNIEL